ncbi:MAG: serine hydrolase domain-containing protein [Gemmatimonadales bacterium]
MAYTRCELLPGRALLAPSLLTACVATLSAQPRAPSAAIDSLVEAHMKMRRIPGAAIAVVRGSRVAYQKAYGVANLESNAPITLGSIFQIASVTKPFTAMAVMRLVEEGKVSLDAPLASYVPEVPATWSGVTVRRLLSHTAGITPGAIVRVDAAGNLTTREGVPLSDITARRTLEVLTRSPVVFPAGERAMYCDACFFLAGLVIERASGLSYPRFMRDRVFLPLGMAHSAIVDRWEIVPGLVPVYSIREGKLVPWRRDWQVELNAYAGIRATIGDLALWDAALRTRWLLNQTSYDAMWTPSMLTNGREALIFGDPYGLGWGLGELRGRRTVEHAGASGTFVLRLRDDDLTVIVLTNLDGPSGSQPAILARGIAGIVNPAYAAPDRLPARPDPSPAAAPALRQLLTDLSEGRESPVMTTGHRDFYRSIPAPARSGDAQLLRSLKSLEYVASDDVGGRIARNGDSVQRIAYYRGSLDSRVFLFTVWLTADGRVAHLRFTPAQ